MADSSAATPAAQGKSGEPEPAGAAGAAPLPPPVVPTDVAPALPELDRIEKLEEKLFNIAYTADSLPDRLSRLEKFVFGVIRKGENVSRLDRLIKVFGKTVSAAESSPAKETAQSLPAEKPVRPRDLLSMINQGIDNYNRHRFHNAEDDFNDALKIAPGMSRIHVYLGSTLLQLNERQAAIDALRAAYELDLFGTYGRYAKNCLIVLMGDEEVRKHGPRDNLRVVKNTLESVNKHADNEAQRHKEAGQILAAIRKDSAGAVKPGPGYYSEEMIAKQRYMRSDSIVQQARARQEAAQRAAATQEAANNLKSLITAKALPGDAKLRAFGTGLNTRYYGNETYNLAPWYIPREAVQELKAKPVLLKAARAKATAPRQTGSGAASRSRTRAH